MKTKPKQAPKLTDTERHKRFAAMAKEVEADESPDALDKAFNKLNLRSVTGVASSGRRK
jgi:hypothetical protein